MRWSPPMTCPRACWSVVTRVHDPLGRVGVEARQKRSPANPRPSSGRGWRGGKTHDVGLFTGSATWRAVPVPLQRLRRPEVRSACPTSGPLTGSGTARLPGAALAARGGRTLGLTDTMTLRLSLAPCVGAPTSSRPLWARRRNLTCWRSTWAARQQHRLQPR